MAVFGQEGRRKQGAFRDASATISNAARHPDDEVGKRNRHLLAHGHEQENLYPSLRGPTGAVRFFGDRKIKWWRSSRSGDSRGTDGPTRNLASSQIACVNFLLPLADVPGALTACLQELDQDVGAIAPIEHGGLTSPVEFEWIGPEVSLEGGTQRGAQNTSTDAFVVAALKGGLRRAYLLEWKYVESYETGRYNGDGRSGETRRARYQHLYRADDSSFTSAGPFDELLYEPLYQIMRLRLLADRMVRCGELGVSQAKVIVVCPEENREYRDRITSPELARRLPVGSRLESAIKSLLSDPEGFVVASPERLGAAVAQGTPDAKIADRHAYHRERYGWSG